MNDDIYYDVDPVYETSLLRELDDSEIQYQAEREAAYQFTLMDFAALVNNYGLDRCLTDLMALINEERNKRNS